MLIRFICVLVMRVSLKKAKLQLSRSGKGSGKLNNIVNYLLQMNEDQIFHIYIIFHYRTIFNICSMGVTTSDRSPGFYRSVRNIIM